MRAFRVATLATAMVATLLPVMVPAAPAAAAPVGAGFELDEGDLRFILRQIVISENHVVTDPSNCAALLGTDVNTTIVEPRLPYGLRTVDGRCNHLTPGTEEFGASDIVFPRLTTPVFAAADAVPAGLPPQFGVAGTPTTYNSTGPNANVFDTDPRLISNLIVDQSDQNPAALVASGGCAEREGFDGPDADALPDTCFTGNTAPDAGLSAPFNSMFTFFGQFFDHGLDLVNKGGNGTVFVPLQPDDALFSTAPGAFNFLTLTRATSVAGFNEANNQTTSYVDQNQTYTSHPAHQVFLREYELVDVAGDAWGPIPVATGHLIDGAIAGNIANWGEVKAQARNILGINLTDLDVGNVPLLATDPYGQFIRGANGFPVVMFPGNLGTQGNLAAPISVAGSLKTDHAFLDDIAFNATPSGRNGPLTPDTNLVADPIFLADGRTPNLIASGQYDNELLDAHFVTGDGRGNENIALTAVHSVFHAEHNRLAEEIDLMIRNTIPAADRALWLAPSVAGWSYGDRLFQAARFVTEMQYQHLVFEEFARTMSPSINAFAPDGLNFQSQLDPSISAEFAHSVYRFGHSMLNESVERIDPVTGQRDTISLFEGFLNPLEFNKGGTLTAAEAAGEIFQGSARQVGNEIDEFVTDSLRNNLLGRPLDLATLNIARGRSEGVPPLNEVRRQLFTQTSQTSLKPYRNWDEFQVAMRNQDSIVNFVAAYGTHPIIQAETTVARRRAAGNAIINLQPYPGADGVLGDNVGTPQNEALDDILPPADVNDFFFGEGSWAGVETGVNLIDLWMGGLAEKPAPFGGMLGSTFNFIFEVQLEDLQNADRFYYLERLDGLNLLAQLEGNSFAELVMRNTTATALPASIFNRPEFVFRINGSNQVVDDPTTPIDESAQVVNLSQGRIRYSGPEHVIWDGSPNNDWIISSEGDDTLRGNDGDDRIEGGTGNDQPIGGNGDDVITDNFGDDIIKGGPGHDAIAGGPGLDLLQGNAGDDFMVGGNDFTESFGGEGDDVMFIGDSFAEAFAGFGDDWLEGSGQLDLLVGDENNQFQDDPNGGDDVIKGNGGDDDYDAEGGNDIMLADVLGTERIEGMLGFDWATYQFEPLPVDADMRITLALPPQVIETRDRYDKTEAISGWNNNDTLRGDDRGCPPQDAAAGVCPGALAEGTFVNNELTQAGITTIANLRALLVSAIGPQVNDATYLFDDGNILLGGAGSDVIEGRGGNDVIDGDRFLTAMLRAVHPTTGAVIETDDMKALQPLVFAEPPAARLNPGTIDIVRRVQLPPVVPARDCGAAVPQNCDTAVFTGAITEYQLTADGSVVRVTHVPDPLNPTAIGPDGVDALVGIERYMFQNNTPDNPADDQFLDSVPLTATPGSLTFATRSVATTSPTQAVTVRNTGTAPVTVTGVTLTGVNPGDFVLTNGCATIAVNGTCTFNVAFRPTAAGARTASVAVVSNRGQLNVPVAGTGVQPTPTLTVTPLALTFPARLAGTTSPTQTVTVSNTGTAAMTVSSVTLTGANPGDFTLTNGCGAVAVGATCNVLVAFRPTANGARTAAVSIVSNGGTASVALSGTGTAPVSVVAPTALTFAAQAVSTTSPTQSVTISNPGTAPLTVSSVFLTGAAPGDYVLTNPCTTTIAAGASCSFTVAFRPIITGTRAASVSVNTNAGNTSVALSGTAFQPRLAVTPTSLTFASQAVGTTSAARTVTVSNTGTGTLTLSSVALTGTNPADYVLTNACTTIAAGASCSFTVAFRPTANGGRSANVSINSNGGTSTVFMNGTAVGPALLVSPTALNFAAQAVSTTSATQSVNLFNTGSAPMTVSSVSLAGANPTDYVLTNGCSTVAAGAFCTVTVAFRPTATGNRTASVSVVTNGGTGTATLTGTATQPVLAVSPGSLTFASQVAGTTSLFQTVTVRNTGTGTLSISSVTLAGTNAGDYVLSNGCSLVGAGGSCIVNVAFRPTAAGVRSASLSIVSNAGTGSVALTGTGTAPAVAVSATALAFGNQRLLTTSAPRSVTITNTGTAPLTVSSVTTSGLGGADFPITNGCFSIAAGASCTFNLTFRPLLIGSRTASLNIATNAGTRTVSLTGTGTLL